MSATSRNPNLRTRWYFNGVRLHSAAMSNDAEKIIDAALRLSAKERELIVERVRQSLCGDDTRTDIKLNWMQEAAQRVERLRQAERRLLEGDDSPELLPARR